MFDLTLPRNPLSKEAVIIFNDVERDHYQDAVVSESERVFKFVMVKKNLDMSYVQEFSDLLLEDAIDEIPWFVYISITGLPRNPKMDDCILIDNVKYTISKVKPWNRDMQQVLIMSIYPERTEAPDTLAVVSITKYADDVLFVDYNGQPTLVSFSGNVWVPLESHFFKYRVDGEDFLWVGVDGTVIDRAPVEGLSIKIKEDSTVVSEEVVL